MSRRAVAIDLFSAGHIPGHALRCQSVPEERMTNTITTRSQQSGSNLWATRGLDRYPTCDAEHRGSELIGFQDRIAAAQTVVSCLAMHGGTEPEIRPSFDRERGAT